MSAKQPLARRIIIAFTLMTLLVSGIFSLSIVAIVHFIEEHLVSQELHRELNIVVHEDLANQRPPRLDPSTHFYAQGSTDYPIPPQFAKAKLGFAEMVDGDEAFYVYRQDIDGTRYLLVQEQHEFEARENALFRVVLAGFIISVIAAWLLGKAMARTIMQPVSRLAEQVQQRDQLLAGAPPLAAEYAADEIGHLAAAFDQTLGALRDTLAREKLFTSDVSHELRTPLMIIAGSCELLEAAELTPKQREQLQRIQRASNEMQDLVQTFLMLARGRSSAPTLTDSATLIEVAQQQYAQWQPAFAQKGLTFDYQVQSQPSAIRYNHTLLRTVIANLLRNALHYTEQGQVQLSLNQQGFSVTDTGVGIAPELQEDLFQPFIRGSNARGEGLGLGLSLVRRICQQQGWQIEVLPTPIGSCFQVQLASSETYFNGRTTASA